MILLFFIALALADGEISITNNPSDAVHCGDAPYNLQWTYDGDADSYFMSKTGDAAKVQIALKYDGLTSNSLIAVLGSVQYPAKSFMITWPKPWPDEWLKNTDVKNDGSETKFLLHVESAAEPDKINNHAPFYKPDDDFPGICCPAGKQKCACNTDNTCEAGSMCDVEKKICSAVTGEVCQATEPKCKKATDICDANNKCVCKPGTLNCVCNASKACEAGQGNCQPEGICRTGGMMTVNIAGMQCRPGDRTLPGGTVCSQQAQPPLACVNSVCTACTIGSNDCACSSNTCMTAGYACVSGRCVPNSGCSGCPCDKGACMSSLVCMGNICTAPATAAPTAPPPVSMGCTDGLSGCPCAKNAMGQVGCASKELKCINGVCKNSAAQSVLAVATIIVAVLVALLQ